MNWLRAFMLSVFTKVGSRLVIVDCLCGESAIVPLDGEVACFGRVNSDV